MSCEYAAAAVGGERRAGRVPPLDRRRRLVGGRVRDDHLPRPPSRGGPARPEISGAPQLPCRAGSAVRRGGLGEREPAEDHGVAVLDAARERDGADGEEEDDKFAAVELRRTSRRKVAALPLPLLATQRLLEHALGVSALRHGQRKVRRRRRLLLRLTDRRRDHDRLQFRRARPHRHGAGLRLDQHPDQRGRPVRERAVLHRPRPRVHHLPQAAEDDPDERPGEQRGRRGRGGGGARDEPAARAHDGRAAGDARPLVPVPADAVGRVARQAVQGLPDRLRVGVHPDCAQRPPRRRRRLPGVQLLLQPLGDLVGDARLARRRADAALRHRPVLPAPQHPAAAALLLRHRGDGDCAPGD